MVFHWALLAMAVAIARSLAYESAAATADAGSEDVPPLLRNFPLPGLCAGMCDRDISMSFDEPSAKKSGGFARGVIEHFYGAAEPARILFIGELISEPLWGAALEDAVDFNVSFAPDPGTLWSFSFTEAPDIAVLLDTLSAASLGEICRLIRHRWPHARILVVRAGENFLDDALYDDRILPRESVEALLEKVFRVARLFRCGRLHDDGR